MTIDPHMHSQKITLSMRRLKFFMRPQVFKDISDFTIECLQKLDLKREIEKRETR